MIMGVDASLVNLTKKTYIYIDRSYNLNNDCLMDMGWEYDFVPYYANGLQIKGVPRNHIVILCGKILTTRTEDFGGYAPNMEMVRGINDWVIKADPEDLFILAEDWRWDEIEEITGPLAQSVRASDS